MSAGGKAGIPQSQQQATRSAPVKATASAPAAPKAAPAAAPRARTSTSGVSSSSTARSAALARRKAMSTRGKQAVSTSDRVRTLDNVAKSAAAAPAARKEGDCGCGCGGKKNRDTQTTQDAPQRAPASGNGARAPHSRNVRRPAIVQSSAKAASLARRKAQSTRGKAGVSPSGMSEAQTARAANPQLSGRELARALRDQRSTRGKTCTGGKCRPTGKVRKKPEPAAAQDASWKVGASQTSHDQTITGTMVGRDAAVTGNEQSTCRTITGTEYMGADVFRDFCAAEPPRGQRRAGLTATSRGNAVTGNEVGRSDKVTGDEPGSCKNVTGSEYIAAGQAEAFCGTKPQPGPVRQTRAETRKGKVVTGDNVGRSDKVTGNEPGAERQLTGTQYMQLGERGNAPPKVGASGTLRGGAVTGTMVGRSTKTTGDEPGACRNVTGDDYVGQEQYQDFCAATPAATDQKVGVSATQGGEAVTGTMTGRSQRVTGDEPGTCKAVTGTPYAGSEQYAGYCEAPAQDMAAARMAPAKRNFGSVMTGQQPGIGGKMTGAGKGACEPVSGTPYVGGDQAAEACPATAAEPGAPDFPQQIGGAPWNDFSVEPPAHASDRIAGSSAVTGSQYEQGQITGPFGMADGKVTGTEQARFGRDVNRADDVPPVAQEHTDGRIKSRITGEGQDAGPKITGDDWERGDHVTGTEGASATVRNPSQRGAPMGAMGARANKPAETPTPVSRVTGSSGNTETGSLITYSGGARG